MEQNYNENTENTKKKGMPLGAKIIINLISVLLIMSITSIITVGIMSPFGLFEYGKFMSFWFNTQRISRLSYGEITPEQLFDGAMQGIAGAAGDPYTMFINREHSEMFMEQLTGGFYGVGLYIAEGPDGYVTVLAPIPGTPAEEAGIVSMDRILKVNGEEVFDSHIAAGLMRGPEGTTVIVTVQRWDNDEIVDLEITRARIVRPSVDSRVFDGNIAYFAISRFSTAAVSEFIEQFNELEYEPSGIIIDLRNNGGGMIDAAIEIAGFFLPDRTLVVYSEGRGSPRREYRTRRSTPLTEAPIVIITNIGSASASEILTGALRDHGRAISVGETTFGKGSIQISTPVRGGGHLNITNARYFTPNGTDIEGTGIDPDILVSLPEDEDRPPLSMMADEDDDQLQAAIAALMEMINQ